MMPVIDSDYAWRRIRDAASGRAVSPDDKLGLIGADGWKTPAGHAIDADAAALLDILWPIASARGPFVVAQIGQSLDGRIATESGQSHYVTGLASRSHLHRLRALVDAVVVGVSTVDADDPQLTVRHVAGEHPVRVVLDPRGRVDRSRGLFAGDGPPTLHVVGPDVAAADGAEPLVVRVLADGRFAPADVLTALAARGLHRVLVEGGGLTVSSFIAAACVDRLHCVVAPFFIGSGRAALTLAPIATLDSASRPNARDFPLGVDRLYDLDLRSNAVSGNPSTSM